VSPFINLKISHHRFLLWVLAFIITVLSAWFQRRTGPAYDLRGKATFQESRIPFRLARSEVVKINAPIHITVPDSTISGSVRFKRFKSNDEWTRLPMVREGEQLSAYLPHQPVAGKVIYFVFLEKDQEEVSLSGDKPIILRYRGEVPRIILLLHVLVIFIAMLLSNRTAFEALDVRGNPYRYMLWTIGALLAGGFVLGPLMQKFAFGTYWTGFPLGTDLTDNKTLITLLGWLLALFLNRRGRDRRGWIVFAAVLLLTAYFIPHSLLGSEIDYTKLKELP
jgi:hypothetical protein